MAAPSRLAAAALAALLLLSVSRVAAAQPAPPELTAPVNDFAGVIDAGTERQLEALVRQLQNASGDVMIVATIKTFQPEADIASYAVKMFENHGRGIGAKGKDNGLLLLLAVDDRSVRAEVGYDLEGIVTDGFAGQVSREVMVPYFRKTDYSGGLLAGAQALAARIADGRGVTLEGVPVRVRERSDDDDFPIGLVIFLLFIGVNILRSVIGAIFGRRPRRRRRRWGSMVGPFGPGYGGGFGGGSWSGGGGFGGGFGGFGGGRSGGGGGGASW